MTQEFEGAGQGQVAQPFPDIILGSALLQRFRLMRGMLALFGFDQIFRVLLGSSYLVTFDMGLAGELADNPPMRAAAMAFPAHLIAFVQCFFQCLSPSA